VPRGAASTTTGLGFFADGLRHSAKAQKSSAKALPRAALGKESSGNFEMANRSLLRALYRAHGKAFAEGKKNSRQRKTLGKM
jgi:hypothetical protein